MSKYLCICDKPVALASLTQVYHSRYTMVGIVPLLYIGYKVLKRSTYYKPEEVDLLKDLDEIEEYEANYQPQPAKCELPSYHYVHVF